MEYPREGSYFKGNFFQSWISIYNLQYLPDKKGNWSPLNFNQFPTHRLRGQTRTGNNSSSRSAVCYFFFAGLYTDTTSVLLPASPVFLVYSLVSTFPANSVPTS